MKKLTSDSSLITIAHYKNLLEAEGIAAEIRNQHLGSILGDMGDVSEDELADFTAAVVPVKISGSLSDPEFSLDLAEAAKERAKEEVRDRLLDLIGGGEEETPPEEGEAAEEPDTEDVLKDRLRDLIKRN